MGSPESFENFGRIGGGYDAELAMVEIELRKFLSDEEELENIVKEMKEIAVIIDKVVNDALNEPGVLEKYRYNGRALRSKESEDFYLLSDGLRFLESLSKGDIDICFSSPSTKSEAIQKLREYGEQFVGVAKEFRRGWQKYGGSKSVAHGREHKDNYGDVSEKIKKVKPLSEKDKDFFRPYEGQMRGDAQEKK